MNICEVCLASILHTRAVILILHIMILINVLVDKSEDNWNGTWFDISVSYTDTNLTTHFTHGLTLKLILIEELFVHV